MVTLKNDDFHVKNIEKSIKEAINQKKNEFMRQFFAFFFGESEIISNFAVHFYVKRCKSVF